MDFKGFAGCCVMLERLKCAVSDGIQGIIWEWIKNAEAIAVVEYSFLRNILTFGYEEHKAKAEYSNIL